MSSSLQLEQLVNQFFDVKIPFEQKKLVDQQLQSWRTRTDAWQDAVQILQQQQMSQHMQWFAFSVLEELVLRHWEVLSEANQDALRDFVLQKLDGEHSQLSQMALNKLMKVIVDIAKRMWPQRFGGLFPLIERALLAGGDTKFKLTGLKLLRTLLEEFVSNKADMPSDRKDELKQLLLNGTISSVLHLLVIILSGVYNSPADTHSRSFSGQGSFKLSVETRLALSFNGQGSIQPPHNGSMHIPRGQFDSDSKLICEVSLDILINLFSWIPLSSGSQFVTLELLDAVLRLTHINDSSAVTVGYNALTCINELLARKMIPQNIPQFQSIVFIHIQEALRHLTDDSDNADFGDLDDEYRARFTEFVAMFIQTNIQRIEAAGNLPLPQFLQFYYRFTLQQPNIYAFRECLTVWGSLLDFLCSQSKNTLMLQKYKNGICIFLSKLLDRMQYDKNTSQLSEIEDAVENAQGLTEYDMFVEECLDLFNKSILLDGYSDDLVRLQMDCFQHLVDRFQSITEVQPSSSPVLLSQAALRCHNFKDLRTLLRAMGSLSSIFSANFEKYFVVTFQLMEQFLRILGCCEQGYQANQRVPEYVNLFAEAYSVFGSYIHWLNLFQQMSCGNVVMLQKFDSVTSRVFGVCFDVFIEGIPESICQAASLIFRQVCTVVKPANLFSYPRVSEFTSNIHAITMKLQSASKANIYTGASHAMLTLFPHLQNEATAEFQQFVDGIVQPFISLKSSGLDQAAFGSQEVRTQVYHVLVALTSFMTSVEGEKAAIRQILYASIKDTIPLSLELLKIYQDDQEMLLHIMELCLALLTSLRRQISPDLLQLILQTFFQAFNDQRFAVVLDRNDSNDSNIATGLLKLLRIVVEENSKPFQAYLSDVIQFILQVCQPAFNSVLSDSSEMARPLYLDLVQAILMNNWKHFFPSQVQSNGSRPVSPTRESVSLFDGLLTILLHAFQSTSLELLKHNVHILDELDNKCRLYHNDYFKSTMRQAFVFTVINVLVDKSHDSIREELTHHLFNMAQVDIEVFFKVLIPSYLETRSDLSVEHRQHVVNQLRVVSDAPSFATFMTRFIDDIMFYYRVDQPALSLVSSAL